jgi:MFS family permease
LAETPAKTNWPRVALLVLSGTIAACQVGKGAVAIPALRQDLGLSLLTASWVVSAYGALGAALGFPASVMIARLSGRNVTVVGLAAIGLGSAPGAFAQSGALLLATRVLEGCGYFGLVIVLPGMVRALAAPRDRDLALAWWAAYMPAGSAAMMLVGPFLMSFGWPALWLVNAVLLFLQAALVWIFVPVEHGMQRLHGRRPRVWDVVRTPAAVILALAFGTYTFHYFALTGLLPTLLVERMGLSVAQAGSITAATVVANAVGNVAAGAAMRRGIPLWAIAAAAFVFAGLASVGIFADAMPVAMIAALASASLAITGLVPASIFAASARLAPTAAALGLTIGLILQASNLGQLLGPVALGGWAEHFGWSSAPILFGAIALAGVMIALQIRLLLRRPSRR